MVTTGLAALAGLLVKAVRVLDAAAASGSVRNARNGAHETGLQVAWRNAALAERSTEAA